MSHPKRNSTRIAGLALVAGAFVLGAGAALANVSVKNGNFFIGYTDIIYQGGFEPKIERVYNSKSPFKGMFGWGWGCEYELRLDVLPEGAVVVHEYGGGAVNYFAPEAFDKDALAKAIESVVRAALDSNAVET